MPGKTMSARLEADELQLLDSLAGLSGCDRSALIKTLLRLGMKELRFEQAVDAYRKESVTLGRAAELAGIHLWDFLARMRDQQLELHYDVEEFEADLGALAREP
jgi:predicted HTH domain antitoxin